MSMKIKKRHKSPFLKDKPSGTLPKREITDNHLLKLCKKIEEIVKNVKKNE